MIVKQIPPEQMGEILRDIFGGNFPGGGAGGGELSSTEPAVRGGGHPRPDHAGRYPRPRHQQRQRRRRPAQLGRENGARPITASDEICPTPCGTRLVRWNGRVQNGVPFRRIDLQPAADLGKAFAHADQSEGRPECRFAPRNPLDSIAGRGRYLPRRDRGRQSFAMRSATASSSLELTTWADDTSGTPGRRFPQRGRGSHRENPNGLQFIVRPPRDGGSLWRAARRLNKGYGEFQF